MLGSAVVHAERADRRRNRRPEIAAFLSFLWPGLGQWYAGRPLRALIFAAPIAVIALAIAVIWLGDRRSVAVWLFQPGVALTVLVVVILAGAWRVGATVDASGVVGPRETATRGSRALVAVLAVIVIASHTAIGSLAWSFHSAGERIFVVDRVSATPSPRPSTSAAPARPTETPAQASPTPEIPERINILLTGLDSDPGRNHELTDTLIVISVDVRGTDAAMVSFPRDISQFPLWDGRIYEGKINSLLSYARQNPDQFPDGPMGTLTREVGYLLGIDLDHYAAINLRGFVGLIDEVGGVTIDNPRRINDPRYSWPGSTRRGFYLDAGRHTLDGSTALAYARSRQGAGDNDFTRAARQQELLVALQSKLTDPAMLPRLSAILDATAETVSTNFPRERLSEVLELARTVDRDRIQRYVLGPPYSTHPPMDTTGGIYTLELDLERVAELSVDLFGPASRYAEPGVR